jgi:hypothetical protein
MNFSIKTYLEEIASQNFSPAQILDGPHDLFIFLAKARKRSLEYRIIPADIIGQDSDKHVVYTKPALYQSQPQVYITTRTQDGEKPIQVTELTTRGLDIEISKYKERLGKIGFRVEEHFRDESFKLINCLFDFVSGLYKRIRIIPGDLMFRDMGAKPEEQSHIVIAQPSMESKEMEKREKTRSVLSAHLTEFKGYLKLIYQS